jgi:predicted small secreted protein
MKYTDCPDTFHAGCNTIHESGKDIEDLRYAMNNSADNE